MGETLRNISVVWSLLHILILFIIFYEHRFTQKRHIYISIAVGILMCLLNFLLNIIVGREAYGKLLVFSLVIPSFIFFFICAKHRDFRFIFTFCLVDTISAELIIVSMLLDEFLTPESHIVMLLLRLLAFPLLEFLAIKKIQKPYLEVQNTVKTGWGIFSLVSVLFYAALLILVAYPTIIISRPKDYPIAIMLLILMPLMYINIFRLLSNQHKLHSIQREQEILRLQSDNLQSRIRQTQKTEELLRIQQHDMRHRLTTIASMLDKNNYTEAKDYIHASTATLENTSPKRYCQNAILDAVLSFYFKQASDKDIVVESTLTIPKTLGIDETEFSIVLSNALENAINACEALPVEERIIKIKFVQHPQVMFQISNPFAGEVTLDENNLPVSNENGHGIGTRSILSFCDKYSAFADYKIKDNWFYLRIVLSDQ